MSIREIVKYVTFPFSNDILGAACEGVIFLKSGSSMEEYAYHYNLLNEAVEQGHTHCFLYEVEEGLEIREVVKL